MKETVVVPYAPILIESTRSIGYSFEAALADIIDNSISARANKIDVDYYSQEGGYLSVTDNGFGMDNKELLAAMRYGSKSSLENRTENDLGRFGLGLKTATTSQCRKLTVISKKDSVFCGAIWDLDLVQQKLDWIVLELSEAEILENPHINKLQNYKNGTCIIWENFDRLKDSSRSFSNVFNEKIEITKQHVGLVFHRFILPEKGSSGIDIYFNENLVESFDPFLINHPSTQKIPEEKIEINGEIIRVKPFILPYVNKLKKDDFKKLGPLRDLSQNQGFYIYRNKRLIIWGTWLKLAKSFELNKLARVRVDIPNTLDSLWEIDVKKSTASIPNIISQSLKGVISSSITKSENVYKHRGRKKNDNLKLDYLWNVIEDRGKIRYEINLNNNMIKEFTSSIDEQYHTDLFRIFKFLASSYPFADLYMRMSKSPESIENELFGDVELLDLGIIMVEKKINNGIEFSNAIELLKRMEQFAKKPEIVEKIEKRYKR